MQVDQTRRSATMVAMEEPERPSRPSSKGPSPAVVGAVGAPSEEASEESDPASRPPRLPPAPDPRKPTRSHRQGPGGTVRMMAGKSEPPAGRTSAPRVSSGSLYPERKSRLSMLRQSLLSALPPLPKSLAAMSTPVLLLGLLAIAAVLAVATLAVTGKLHLGPVNETAPEVAGLVPPALRDLVDVDEELDLPSAEPGRANVGRGVLSIPRSFTAADDGAFDLVIHFHGNTDLAVESYEVALLDSVVLVLNLGNGSGAYEDRFANPAQLQKILERVPKIVEKRGLANAHVGRIALVGWSAGYGAIIKILADAPSRERIDAVILLDGLHSSYRAGTKEVDGAPLAGVLAFAEQAVRGERLLLVTHSEIRPDGYLGVAETVNYLLGKLDVVREERSLMTTIPALKAARGVLPRADLRPLELKSEARKGGLVVRGYGGQEPAHHISHLMEMSVIALPELAKRWQPE